MQLNGHTTNSFDQDLTNQSEQADRDTPFLQTG